MSELASVVERARSGEAQAFETLVRRFQDMAVGYGYSLLGDIQLAEDAAQEAFFEAFRSLGGLREPAAFPGWFRRIVFKQCDRINRSKRGVTIPIESVTGLSDRAADQLRSLEQREMADRIWQSVQSLPEHEREALVLFYIGGYSQIEVGEFLDLPVGTVKKRLHSARNRLRDLLVTEVEDVLRERRPSRTEDFALQVIELLQAAKSGDSARVMALLDRNPRLRAARDPLGNTALVIAVTLGHHELAEMLLESGPRPDLHEAAAIGRTDLVSAALAGNPERIDEFSAEGFTALGLAAHFGHIETTKLLLDRGADKNIVSKHPLEVTPLHASLFGGKEGTARLLLEYAADPRPRRGGTGWPRAGWTALHYAASYGFVDLIEELVRLGADVDAADDAGKTPRQVARESGQLAAIEALRTAGLKG
jgi:RNA polymerase sigma factor (sigma-70 family)